MTQLIKTYAKAQRNWLILVYIAAAVTFLVIVAVV